MVIDDATLDNWFNYHSPTPEDQDAYAAIRSAGRNLAKTIVDCTPASADQSAAIRHVRDAVMSANAARACGGV